MKSNFKITFFLIYFSWIGYSNSAFSADLKTPMISSDGIERTLLENYEIPGSDQEFKMVLTVYPPSVGLPPHHHPSAALNYLLYG